MNTAIRFLFGAFLCAVSTSGCDIEGLNDFFPQDDAGTDPDVDSNTGADDESDVDADTDADPILVQPSDTVLVRPEGNGPILATVTGYEMSGRCPWKDEKCEIPIYKTYDRDSAEFWDVLVDELLLSRVDVVMLHGRGCWGTDSGTAGTGNMCPRLLTKFVDAVTRANAESAIRVGMWDDTGAYNKALQHLEDYPSGTRFDLGNRNNWKYFWDHNMKIWFDTIPKKLWFLMDGKPVVAFWSLSSTFFTNQQGNASALLSYLKNHFIERYGIEPAFILDQTWMEKDSNINSGHAVGCNAWFNPKISVYTYRDWNGEKWGAVVPGFRNPDTHPGCASACREMTRDDGKKYDDALKEGHDAKFILLEGWTDIAESAGYYRSAHWRYPNQYINLTRRHADSEPETLRFQAEAADSFSDTTNGNAGNQYIDGDLDIGKLNDNTGWYVGWTEAGEWIEYQEVKLGCGTYRFTARVSTVEEGKRIRLDLSGLQSVTLPNTGSWDSYQLVQLGEVKLHSGIYNLRVRFETGGVDLDWFFLKKSNTSCD